jgi:membrane-associated phospholipid phosphatase
MTQLLMNNTSTLDISSLASYQPMDSNDITIERGTAHLIECDAPESGSTLSRKAAVDDAFPPNESTTTSEFKQYWRNPFFVTELFLCILFGVLGHFAPSKIFLLQLHVREIPYQLTANQDLILDQYINRPLVEKETIPDWLLLLLSFVFPLILLVVHGTVSKIRNDLHSSVCALFFSMGSSTFITSFVKLYVGYYRPNIYEYCDFSGDSLECSLNNFDPRKSFPSGHSSSSFCSMTFLTLFFVGKVGIHSCTRQRISLGVLMKKRCLSILSGAPLMLALFIAVSRVHDDMHHPADVVAGAVIGISCAVFGHGLW